MEKTVQTGRGAHIYHSWIYMALLMFSYVIAGINTYRLQPVLTTVMTYLSIDESRVGLLMSMCSFVSLCCSIPFGLLIEKIGCRATMAFALAVEAAGSLVGYFFTDYIGIALSQLLFGLTSTIAMVCAPFFLQLVYTRQKYSTAVGYLNSCQTAGMALAYLLPSLFVARHISWVWLWTVIPAGLLLVLWLPLVGRRTQQTLQERMGSNVGEVDAALPEESAPEDAPPMESVPVWRITLATFFIMFSAGAVLSFASSYLTTQRGIPEMTAARIVLSSAVVGMVCSAAAGWVCRKLGMRLTFVVIVIILTVLRPLTLAVPDGVLLYVVMALQGVPAASIVVMNAVIPFLCRAVAHRPLAISMVATASTAGMCVSAAVFGGMITHLGYSGAFLALIPISLLGLIGAGPLPKGR